MPRVYAALVRHGHFERPGELPSAHSLRPLSAQGRAQAKLGAEALIAQARRVGAAIDPAIECSTLLRAYETAELLRAGLEQGCGRSFSLRQTDALRERGMGAAANLEVGEIEALLAADPRVPKLPEGWRRIPGFRLPVAGAESLVAAGERAAARIEASTRSLAERTARSCMRIFVAHAGCLRHAAVHFGVLELESAADLSMDYVEPVVLERLGGGRWVQVAGSWKKRLVAAGAASRGGNA